MTSYKKALFSLDEWKRLYFHSMSEYCLARNAKFYQLHQSQNEPRFNDVMMMCLVY